MVLASASDEMLEAVSAYRSRGRLPVLSWARGGGICGCIVRCSQPRSKLTRKRCVEDEELFNLFVTGGEWLTFVDARPRVNAVAQQARGGGSEVMAHYPRCKLEFGNIANIHVMRKDVQALEAAIADEGDSNWFPSVQTWLSHISLIMDAAKKTVREVEAGRPVCVHCSDGWDRTAQISALAQVILDANARTVLGFLHLLEREWVRLGHKFSLRLGVGSSVPDEESPVFLQFLDCVHQVMIQHPTAFEFSSLLLVATMDASLSGRFSTFLFNCEKERLVHAAQLAAAPCFYEFALSNKTFYLNPRYRRSEDALKVSSSFKRLRLWDEWFLRYVPTPRK